jgi:hypothetical protein
MKNNVLVRNLAAFAALVLPACAGSEAPMSSSLGAAGAFPSAPITAGTVGVSHGAAGSISVGAAGAASANPGGVTPPPPAAGSAAPSATPLTWCDIEPVLKSNCQLCHAAMPLYGAPMPLVTYADLMAPSKLDATKPVFKLVGERVQDTARPMPPSGQPILTADGHAKLVTWTAAGAPQGPAQVCAAPGGDVTAPPPAIIPGRAITDDAAPWPEDCGEHYKLVASGTGGGKYQIAAGRQFYANVMIPAPWGTKNVQALRFRAVVDNTKVLHHYILYGPDQSFIDGWAPGQGGITMPPTVGMQLPNGQYRLELHYNNETGTKMEEDASGIEVCVATTPRPNVAAVHELGSMAINVPAHGMQDLVAPCKPTVAKGMVHLMEVNPHMHRTGVHAKLTLKRGSGPEMIVHDAPFSFDDQRKYILPEDGSAADLQVMPGDSLTATCSFKNDRNTPVTFGQNTEDEMCFFYVIAWPMGQLVNGTRGPEGDPNACLGQ